MSYKLITNLTAANQTAAAYVPAVFGYKREIKYLTIHWWGSPANQSLSGIAHYLASPNKRQVSAHYVVAHGIVYCLVAPDNAAWHAGNSRGNAQSIGIECDPNSPLAYETVAELVHDLRKVYGDKLIVGHKFWTPTTCPGNYDIYEIDRMSYKVNDKPPKKPAKPTPPKKDKDTDPMPYTHPRTHHGEKLTASKWNLVHIDDDHPSYVSMLAGRHRFNVTADIAFSGLQADSKLMARFVAQEYRDGKSRGNPRSYGALNLDPAGATSYRQVYRQEDLGKDHRLRLYVYAPHDGITIDRLITNVQYWDR